MQKGLGTACATGLSNMNDTRHPGKGLPANFKEQSWESLASAPIGKQSREQLHRKNAKAQKAATWHVLPSRQLSLRQLRAYPHCKEHSLWEPKVYRVMCFQPQPRCMAQAQSLATLGDARSRGESDQGLGSER